MSKKPDEIPTWALIPMWLSTLIGAFFLTRDLMWRFGMGGPNG